MAAVSRTSKDDKKKRSFSTKGKSFKPQGKLFTRSSKKEGKQNSDDALPAAVSSALLADEDRAPDFPRGGAKLLSRGELAEVRAEAEMEFEAETREGKRRIKGKKDRGAHAGGDDEWASLFGEGKSGKLPRFANRVALKNISSNIKLWGAVTEVNDKDLVISLPGGLRGFVRAEDACDLFSPKILKDSEGDLLSSIFHVGMLVPCVVLRVEDEKVEGKVSKRIMLSLHLSLLHKGLTLDSLQDGMVLNAVVKSVEDHGYILHFGTPFSGFLSKDCEDAVEIKLKTWQIVQCVVKRIDMDHSLVYVSANTDLASKSTIKDPKGFTIDSFVPGMLVNARLHAMLENGLMLSFLSYFTGTVDIFNLETMFPTAAWKDAYHVNQKFKARILFIDPTTRAIGLTLGPHLIRNSVPPSYVKAGDIFDDARIVRVDRGMGLLLEIPSSPEVSPLYISRLDAADVEVPRLEKRFKEGSHVRARVIGVKHLEGMGIGTLKSSAFEGSIFTHEDVIPGMLARAKVIAVESYGAVVQFPSGVKALCPVPHMSEFEIAKPSKKFRIGSELLFRVLGCKLKRITVTYKKTLVKSKLQVLSSYADAFEGMITHGWISKIENHGCFVKFYNGVHGFAHRSELGLEPGTEPTASYHVGQVIKCRILSSIPASRRIIVSFILSSKRATEMECVKIGSLVSGVVTRVTTDAVFVELGTSSQKGFIYNDHLADHHGQVPIVKSFVKPGYMFEKLLVLDIEGNNMVLSAKSSLISSDELPLDITQIHQHSVIHGYICNMIESGCFVRFLGRLTGFCPKFKASVEEIGELPEVFFIGQSVRSYVANVNIDTQRILLSLKQSSCSSVDTSFIENYFLIEEKFAGLQSSNCESSSMKKIQINQILEGVILEKKDFGVVVNLLGQNDVVGFISNHQLGGRTVEKGSTVKALVLDISYSDDLVDLTLKSELLGCYQSTDTTKDLSKKKRRKDESNLLELHETKNAVVEIVKENYLVLSLPECNNAIGYASLVDYNTQKFPRKSFKEGQSVLVSIEALPSSSLCGRLLLLLKTPNGALKSPSIKKLKKSSYVIGTLVQAEITDINHTAIFLKFGFGCRGRVHITEVLDVLSTCNPVLNFRVGQVVNARIVAKGVKGYHWEMTLKPSQITESIDKPSDAEFDFAIGEAIGGFVTKVAGDWVSLAISRTVSAQLFVLDSSCDPEELKNFQIRYSLGMPVSGHVIAIDKDKRLLRMTCRLLGGIRNNVEPVASDVRMPNHLHQDDVVGGRVKKILPGIGGLLVQIGPHLHGKAHYTELVDEWSTLPPSGFQEGQYVRCRILELSHTEGLTHIDLTLRASAVDAKKTISVPSNSGMTTRRYEKVEELHVGMNVKGYVKNISSKGCFIMLSRKIDARIYISNLADGYVEKPETEFPVGKLVEGRILSVEILSGRVDVTLKSENASNASKTGIYDFSNLHEGDTISGKIKRIEPYGLFVAIDNTNVVGLCHISEISDDHVENIESKFKVGSKVNTRILKIDPEKRRISLGMKGAHLMDSDATITGYCGDTLDNENYDSRGDLPDMAPVPNLDVIHDIFGNQPSAFLRPSVPPLDVKLEEDINGSDLEDGIFKKEHTAAMSKAAPENPPRHLKKKEKEKRELEVSASEERRLKNDIPRTVDDFERLVRSSPNSSFLWIKYMAFHISLAEAEKARSVAERALRTINFREENEKLNVWVAYFNLENEYGNPREDAVKKLFERALQVCDPKKLHVALLGIYERTEQDELAQELLRKLTKKFKNSCKVWVLYVHNLLKGNKDDVQNVISRALLSLPQKKHIKFISQAAILEFKFGLPDRGQKLFEEILREYPKRTDIWSIYIDQVIRLGDPDVTRSLFERATCLTISPKRMKFLFKKYLEFEKTFGNEEKVEYVKKRALEYVVSNKG